MHANFLYLQLKLNFTCAFFQEIRLTSNVLATFWQIIKGWLIEPFNLLRHKEINELMNRSLNCNGIYGTCLHGIRVKWSSLVPIKLPHTYILDVILFVLRDEILRRSMTLLTKSDRYIYLTNFLMQPLLARILVSSSPESQIPRKLYIENINNKNNINI